MHRTSGSVFLLFLREIGPARNRFPCRELPPQVFELCRGGFIGIVAEEKMVRRIRGLDRLYDRVCSANRITRLFAGDGADLTAPHTSRRRIIVNLPLAFVSRTPGPIGTEAARLDKHHLDAQGFHLLPECSGQTFNCKLRRVVVAECTGMNKGRRWKRN